MLERRYINAEIRKFANETLILKIHYSYYSLFNFTETFILKTLEEAKDKLIEERTSGNLIIVNLVQTLL